MRKLCFPDSQAHPVWSRWRPGGWLLCLLVAFCGSGLAQPVAAQTPPTCAAGSVGPLLATGTPSPRPTLVASAKFIKQTATGAATGADWDNALGATALKATIEAGGTVYLAAGLYTPSSVIDLKNNSTGHFIYGGFPANATGKNLAGYDPNANPTIITGANVRQIFQNIIYVQNITLQGLVLQNANGASGAVFQGIVGDATPVTFRFIDLLVRNNQISGYGAFYFIAKTNPNTQLLFLNSTFAENRALSGAAITGSDVSPGYTPIGPVNRERMVIDGVSFVNNVATSHGGALYVTSSHLWTIRNSSFCGNRTNMQGGAIYFTTAFQHQIVNSTFSNNRATFDGGVLLATTATVAVDGSYFIGNQAGAISAGGAMYGTTAAFTVNNSAFYNNQAGAGGAIFHTTTYGGLPSKVENSIFVGNQAIYPNSAFNSYNGVGGAISVLANAIRWDFINNKFVNNSVPAGGWGGALASYAVKSIIVNNLFAGNTIGGNARASGSDLRQYDTSGTFEKIQDSKLQLASAAAYLNQIGTTPATAYSFTTGNTFNNTDTGATPPAPTITCPTSLPAAFGVGAPVRNFCPALTVNLASLHTGTTPTGVLLLWSTDVDPSNGVSSVTPALTASRGAHVAYYYDGANQCYSPASVAVTVDSVICDGTVDTDGDGVINDLDGDDDNDGLLDTVEGSSDSDGDAILDRVDLDSDNDGMNDVREAGAPGASTIDANNDGQADGTVDVSGLPSSVPASGLTPPDTDEDGMPDFRDLDSDNDGINDLIERNNLLLDEMDGLVDGGDTDGDGLKDAADGRVGFGDGSDPTPANLDADPVPNYRDLDSNGDGRFDLHDSDAALSVDANNDGRVDGTADPDDDGLLTAVDGAPLGYGDLNSPTTADLAVTKAVNVTTITPGVPFTYQVIVYNAGPHSAPNVVLTEVVPTTATINAMAPSSGGNCTQTANTIRCTWPTLAPNASATVMIVVTP